MSNKATATEYIAEQLGKFVEQNGYIPKYFNPYNCRDCSEFAPTITTNCRSLTTSATVLVIEYIEE